MKRTNEQKCNETWNDTEWTSYWGVDADDDEDYEPYDPAREYEDLMEGYDKA